MREAISAMMRDFPPPVETIIKPLVFFGPWKALTAASDACF